MKQAKNFNLWIFRGDESPDKALTPDRYYIGATPGGDVQAGPYASEEVALGWGINELTNTAGT